jgi:hypothetical protein
VAQARRSVIYFCRDQDLPESVVDDAALLVSELTGNTVLHARPEARISVVLEGAGPAGRGRRRRRTTPEQRPPWTRRAAGAS